MELFSYIKGSTAACKCPVAVPEISCSLFAHEISTAATRSPCLFCHWQRAAHSPPDTCCGRTIVPCCGARNFLFAGRSRNFDRCHSLSSLLPPPAALASLPLAVKIGNANTRSLDRKVGAFFCLQVSCCGARNFLLAIRSRNFDRCHSFALLVLPLAARGSLPTGHLPRQDDRLP